jgi:hypothetical protein
VLKAELGAQMLLNARRPYPRPGQEAQCVENPGHERKLSGWPKKGKHGQSLALGKLDTSVREGLERQNYENLSFMKDSRTSFSE